MREILLLRHARPDYRGGARCYIGCRTDPPVLPIPEAEAAPLRALLRARGVTGVWSSPMLRCRQTAEAIAGGLPLGVVPGLEELDCGDWDGLSFDEIRARYPEEYALRGEDPTRPMPGGETLDALAARALDALGALLARTEGNLAAVAHAGVNRVLIRALTGRPFSEREPIAQPYLCVNVLRFDGAALSVAAVAHAAAQLLVPEEGREHEKAF